MNSMTMTDSMPEPETKCIKCGRLPYYRCKGCEKIFCKKHMRDHAEIKLGSMERLAERLEHNND